MKDEIHEIKTEMVKIVRSKCPYIAGAYNSKDFEYNNKCPDCEFLIDENHCGWDVYVTELLSESSETEPDDGLGGLPDSSYYKAFPCARCGKVVKYYSGMSWFGYGDRFRCKECGALHMYLGSGEGIVFAVPKVKMQDKS